MKCLKYSLRNLPEAAQKKLGQGWCIDENPRHLWLSKGSWFDTRHDELYHETGKETDRKVLEAEFQEFLGSLALPPEMLSEIRALWEDNEANEVEWE